MNSQITKPEINIIINTLLGSSKATLVGLESIKSVIINDYETSGYLYKCVGSIDNEELIQLFAALNNKYNDLGEYINDAINKADKINESINVVYNRIVDDNVSIQILNTTVEELNTEFIILSRCLSEIIEYAEAPHILNDTQDELSEVDVRLANELEDQFSILRAGVNLLRSSINYIDYNQAVFKSLLGGIDQYV